MRVFVTGATGFIGSAIVPELINAGHQVLGLARSDAGAKSLIAAGAQVHRGDLEDLESLRSGAAMSDGVIHTAFIHDFSKFEANCEIDRRAIEALGAALAGSDRPLVVTSGTALLAPGRLATEEDGPLPTPRSPRFGTGRSFAGGARRTRVGGAPPARSTTAVKHGLVTYLIALAREKGVSAYVGDGLNRWPAVHRLDAAHLYQACAGEGRRGWPRYHAVAEEGVPFREIAEVDRPGPEGAGRHQVPRGGSRAFWLARILRGYRCSGLKRANAGTAGMAPNKTAWAHCRSRPRERLRSLRKQGR